MLIFEIIKLYSTTTGNMGMTPEQAAAAIQAAKVAQKMAMERNFDKLPQGFFPPQLDISKLTNPGSSPKSLNLPNVTIEPTNNGNKSSKSEADDRDDAPPPNMMSSFNSNNNNNNINSYNKAEESSADERNYSDDEGLAVN